nr:ArsR family transcriptional regulator [uncultured Fluviicola sp.]
MGARKDNYYSPEEINMSQFGRALSHPARAKMLRLLREYKSFRNTDMCRILNMSVSTVHNHIRTLKEADLVNLEYASHEYHITLKEENYMFYKDLID